jgi:hypothetical protein
VWGMSDDSATNTTWTPNANSALDITDASGPTDSVTVIGWRGVSRTSVPGIITLGGTWGASATSNHVGLEVLPILGFTPAPAVVPSGAMLLFI